MNDSYAYMLVKAILTLVFVLGLLGASLYALKYYVNRTKGRGGRAPEPIKVISTMFLGQKKNLTIIEVAGEILVLGITPTSINCLAKLESPEAIDEIRKFDNARQRSFNLFSVLGGGSWTGRN